MKKILALLLAMVMVVSMAACGASFDESISMLVQGNIDSIYLGRYSEEYLELVNASAEECEQDYLDGIEMEAEYFSYYFDIEYLEDDLKAEIMELYKEIYSHSKYSVSSVSRLDDTTYAVKISVSPIDIVELVSNNFESGMADFYAKYENADIESMSDEEYAQYDRDWADAILAMFYEQLPNLGYKEEQTMALQVVKDSDDMWSISDNDMGSIDTLIIYYP